ncbi:MAG: phasin family protein [Rhodocyclaceae bacterium]|nr:phasin family protein [Rhodocyclaceae bacterium]MBX3667724.1 phasin family protein [Rhodocyclaceae bacterium]
MEAKFVNPEEVLAAAKANVDSALAFATVGFNGIERLSALNLNTSRVALDDLGANAKAVVGVTEAEGYMAIASAAAKPALEKAVAYSRNVYEILAATQAELAKMVEAKAAEVNKSVASALESAAKSAPVGSDAALAAVKQVLGAADTAYANLTGAVKKATEVAEARLESATQAALDAVGKAAVIAVPVKKAA